MFGNDKYKKAKNKRFSSDKQRRRFFAIKNNYENNNMSPVPKKPTKKK